MPNKKIGKCNNARINNTVSRLNDLKLNDYFKKSRSTN